MNQTPGGSFDSVATIKSILELTEKTKTERSNTELKLGVKSTSAKFFTPVQQNIKIPSPSGYVTFRIRLIRGANLFLKSTAKT